MDNTLLDFTQIGSLIDEMDQKCQEMIYKRQRFIEWSATKDMIYWDEVEMRPTKRPSATQLAQDLNVSRQTLYNWPEIIPNFSDQVEHIKSIIIEINISSVWNATYMLAMNGSLEAIKLYLNTFDPTFREASARKRKNLEPDTKNSLRELYDYHVRLGHIRAI